MALFLKSFELLVEYRDIKPFKVEFKDGINIIVGENGSGKSSMMHLLTEYNPKDGICKIIHDNVEYRFLDTEKHNPRLKHDLEYSKNIRYELSSHFVSHGEAMLPLILASEKENFKDIILLVDEPESGISLSNQKKIAACFKSVVTNNCQIIATTHSFVLMKSVDEVFSLDDKKWVSSAEYLARVL